MHDRDVESLAIWLHWTAHSTGQTEAFGNLIRGTVNEVAELYGVPSEADGDVPTLIGRFAAKWDECERLVRGETESEAGSPEMVDVIPPAPEPPREPGVRVRTETDRWGYALGTQAAEINQILTTPEFQSVSEVFEKLSLRFPTTTRARVNTHIQVLRQRYGLFLHEQRDGRRVSFRLAVEPIPPAESKP